jgi:nicotinamide-nucleotide amidase
MNKTINDLVEQLGKVLCEKEMKIATAESCTGGGIAQALTEISGSSAWFDRGFVTYSNIAKVELLQVKPLTLDKFGSVSKEVAVEMVEGALAKSNAGIALSVTGIAGPRGGSLEKPVGTVYIAWKTKGQSTTCRKYSFIGDRARVRQESIETALIVSLEHII